MTTNISSSDINVGQVPEIIAQKRANNITAVVMITLSVLLIAGAVLGYFFGLNTVGIGLLAGFGGLILFSFVQNAVKEHRKQKELSENCEQF